MFALQMQERSIVTQVQSILAEVQALGDSMEEQWEYTSQYVAAAAEDTQESLREWAAVHSATQSLGAAPVPWSGAARRTM